MLMKEESEGAKEYRVFEGNNFKIEGSKEYDKGTLKDVVIQ